MLNVLIFAISITCSFFAFADKLDDAYSKQATAGAKCKASLEDKRLNPIRGNILIWSKAELRPIDQLDKYPTKNERKALAILYDLKLQCFNNQEKASAEVDKAFNESMNELGLTPNKSTDFSRIDKKFEGVDYWEMLANLRDGKITYATLIKWSQRAIEHSLAELDKIRTARNERLEAKNPFTLTCTMTEPADIRGVEFIYRIDPGNNTVQANKGPIPRDVRITSSEINWVDDDATTSISRLTGSINVSARKINLLMVGSCEKRKAKF